MTDATTKFTFPRRKMICPRLGTTSWPICPAPPPPPLHPGTGQPIGPDDLAPLFPMAIIGQEVSTERQIEIPEPVRDIYRLWRPTPLYPGAAPGEGARLPPASHLLQVRRASARPAATSRTPPSPQAYYNKQEGVEADRDRDRRRPVGQLAGDGLRVLRHRDARSTWSRSSYDQKPYRRAMMETWGANACPARARETNAGRAILAEDPESTGSLGIAISEAVEDAATREDTKYSLGSVLNHVLLHQTVIGQEALKQMEMADA